MFREIVKTEEELRSITGYPSELVKRKAISYIDHHCRDFISRSPFVIISTADSSGSCDASPRGDMPGFVLVLDEKRLVIPERPGNRRIDSMRNILSNPQIGLLFLIPGLGETLRINGKAFLVKDGDLLEQMTVHGKKPLIGIVVEVEECFIHCAKAFKRSRLWETESWEPIEELPSAPKILADHAKLEHMTEDDIAKRLKEGYEKRLYCPPLPTLR